MRLKLRITLVPLMLLILLPAAALAQKPENNWSNLNSLQVGQKVEVVDMDMKTHKGTFLAYNDESLSIRADKGDLGIERTRVLRVSNRERSKRLRNTLIGAAIGAAAGLAVGAGFDASFSDETNIAKTLLTPIGAGAGAGIGAAFASYDTIYRAPQRTKP
jgi:hypothetical protein